MILLLKITNLNISEAYSMYIVNRRIDVYSSEITLIRPNTYLFYTCTGSNMHFSKGPITWYQPYLSNVCTPQLSASFTIDDNASIF